MVMGLSKELKEDLLRRICWKDKREVKKVRSEICNCGYCGKEFFVPIVNEWVYRRKDFIALPKTGELKFFCSWGCMRKFDKEYEEKLNEKRAKKYERKNRVSAVSC
jgi:hypothetical protein